MSALAAAFAFDHLEAWCNVHLEIQVVCNGRRSCLCLPAGYCWIEVLVQIVLPWLLYITQDGSPIDTCIIIEVTAAAEISYTEVAARGRVSRANITFQRG